MKKGSMTDKEFEFDWLGEPSPVIFESIAKAAYELGAKHQMKLLEVRYQTDFDIVNNSTRSRLTFRMEGDV